MTESPAIHYIDVLLKKSFRDRHGEHVRQEIADTGMQDPPAVKAIPVYRVEGGLSIADVENIAANLLTDPVTETYRVRTGELVPEKGGHAVEVWLKAGVTDTVAESVVKAVADLGIGMPVRVKTGHAYLFATRDRDAVRRIAERLLANPIVQEYTISGADSKPRN